MKKTLLIWSFAGLFTTSLAAQTATKTTGSPSFGLRAGVNFNTFNGKNSSGSELDNNISTGFHAGLTADIPVAPDSYLQPGLLYSLKGAEYANGAHTKLSYVEIPVNFLYKPSLGTGNLLVGFGPYVAFGVDGKNELSNGVKTDVEFGNDDAVRDPSKQYFKRTDGGANLLAGYEFTNKVSVQLNAQLGLANINPDNNGQAKTKNTGFGLSLGYRF